MDNRSREDLSERRLIGVNGFYVQRRNVDVEGCAIGEIANITPNFVFLSFSSMAEKFEFRLNTPVCELQSLSLVDSQCCHVLYMNY